MANLNDSLNKLSSLSSSGELSRVNIRRPGRGKPGGESAKNLLGDLLNDSAEAAEAERIRKEEERKRVEEEERMQKELEEEKLKLEAEQALMTEQQAQEALREQQAKLQAQVQREKDIEAGLIDLEEEARQKREEEERKRAEEDAKRKKEEERQASIERQAKQQAELEALQKEELVRRAVPKKSKAVPVIIVAACVVVAALAAVYIFKIQPDMEKEARYFAAFDLAEKYESRGVAFLSEDQDMTDTYAINIVKQGEDPKPVKVRSKKDKGGSGGGAATTTKPTLGGGLLGSGKL